MRERERELMSREEQRIDERRDRRKTKREELEGEATWCNEFILAIT